MRFLPVLATFRQSGYFLLKNWRLFDFITRQHCIHNNILGLNPVLDQGRCPATWDGWQCWPDGGSPDRTEYQSCPSYIYFHSNINNGDAGCGGYAEKKCTGQGRWFYTNTSGEWTNYTTCSKVKAHLTQEKVHVVLYIVSVVALTPAILIFFSYKVLRVLRIAIHKNLFASLLLHCISMITFKCAIFLPYIQDGRPHQSLLQQVNLKNYLLIHSGRNC